MNVNSGIYLCRLRVESRKSVLVYSQIETHYLGRIKEGQSFESNSIQTIILLIGRLCSNLQNKVVIMLSSKISETI